MKKRIFSVILASVMLLSMIPALAVGAENPAIDTLTDSKTYRSILTTETVNVDGELDDVYKDTQKITGSSTDISFEAYTAVTLQGVYVWAEIKDGTLNKSASVSADTEDKFSIYIKMYDGEALSWGWYDTDYNGKILKHNAGDVSICDAETAGVKLADGSGWRSETFIPFSVRPSNLKTYEVAIGLQADNGSSVCYDKSTTGSAQNSCESYTKLRLVAMDDVPYDGILTKNAVYVSGGGFTIDGIKDALYSECAKVELDIIFDNGVKSTVPENLGTVYMAFDDEYIYVYYERYDDDLIDDVTNDRIDSFQTCYWFENGGSVKSGYFTARVNPNYDTEAQQVIFTHPGSGYRNWPGTTIGTANMTAANASLGNDTYGVEYKMPIPETEKAKLAAGQSADLKMVFSATDFCSDGSDEDTLPDTCFYAGCNPDAAYTYSEYNAYKDKMSYLTLSKSFTAESYDDYESIAGASLSLGSDITVNYYANIKASNVRNAYMRFTFNGREYIAYPKRDLNSGMYMFAFKNVAPQTIGDSIKAELIVDGEAVASHDGYSARQNCVNLLANEAYSSNVKMNNLIKSLLNYGAAAQGYAGYKTDEPVHKDYRVKLYSPEASDSVRNITAPISDDLKMTAVGVYFDSDNKIYVKFTASSLSGVSVTMNGEVASIEKFDEANNIYIAYSNSIPVSQFAVPYDIVLSNGSASQTATYSVNSYTYAKLSSSNEDMVELAKATFTYGDAAKKYVGFGDTLYTVMTYNDADNNEPYNDKHSDVIQIIKDNAPDLVGMQEVQETQESDYETGLSAAGYGWIWNSRGASSGDHYLGELLKPSGVAIAYRTDKFELIETKHLWLSDTPTEASKYDESDYTHDFVTALLKDKTTGETFLFVSAHLNYLSAANEKQANKLIELLETDNEYLSYSSYRKVIVGDFNCDVGYEGYNIMNDAGYFTAESMIANSYKPTTAPNLSYIDYCFIKSGEFKAIDYKVINDHRYSLTASDHYPVVSDILTAATYEDVLLRAIPEDPDYNDHDDEFVSDDDREGF